MTKYIDTDEANKLFTFIVGGRSNGKCAAVKQLLKQAKIIKDLKLTLNKMYDGVLKALDDTDIKETDKNYLLGSQDCIETIRWIIYKGEQSYVENEQSDVENEQ